MNIINWLSLFTILSFAPHCFGMKEGPPSPSRMINEQLPKCPKEQRPRSDGHYIIERMKLKLQKQSVTEKQLFANFSPEPENDDCPTFDDNDLKAKKILENLIKDCEDNPQAFCYKGNCLANFKINTFKK